MWAVFLFGHKTFAERLPSLVAPHAQRTSSARELLRVIGEAVDGEEGARLSHRLAMPCSPDPLLRLVRQAALPSSSSVRALGVDEWAWRRARSYSTIAQDPKNRTYQTRNAALFPLIQLLSLSHHLVWQKMFN